MLSRTLHFPIALLLVLFSGAGCDETPNRDRGACNEDACERSCVASGSAGGVCSAGDCVCSGDDGGGTAATDGGPAHGEEAGSRPSDDGASGSQLPWDRHGALRVRAGGHLLEHEDGTDFFLLSDTGWHAPSLKPADVDRYLDNRAALGFNAVQITADNFGMGRGCNGDPFPNYDGQHAFNGTCKFSALSVNEAYWKHIDAIVDAAAKRGLYVLLVAAWGYNLQDAVWSDPANQLHEYGRFLGDRYRDAPNVIFCAAGEFTTVTGGTGSLNNPKLEGYLRRLGEGIASGKAPAQLITMHGRLGQHLKPDERYRSSDFFHDDSWLDFHGNQTWHYLYKTDDMLLHDRALANPKPTFNMEPGYEDASYMKDHSSTAWGARAAAWWGAFNGACGHSYGHAGLASMCSDLSDEWGSRNGGVLHPSALDAEGGADMQHLKALLLSNGMTYAPDQSLIVSPTGSDYYPAKPPDKRYAVLDADGDFAYVYLTQGGEVSIDVTKIAHENVTARWYDPRTGDYTAIDSSSSGKAQSFTAPSSGPNEDWVLVLEGQ